MFLFVFRLLFQWKIFFAPLFSFSISPTFELYLQKQVEDLQKEKSEMNEKEKKFTRLLQLARQQLEKLRKESQVKVCQCSTISLYNVQRLCIEIDFCKSPQPKPFEKANEWSHPGNVNLRLR